MHTNEIKPRGSKAKSVGILVARAMIQGDFERARAEAGCRCSWTVSEMRAILGAQRYALRKYGALPLNFLS